MQFSYSVPTSAALDPQALLDRPLFCNSQALLQNLQARKPQAPLWNPQVLFRSSQGLFWSPLEHTNAVLDAEQVVLEHTNAVLALRRDFLDPQGLFCNAEAILVPPRCFARLLICCWPKTITVEASCSPWRHEYFRSQQAISMVNT